MNVTRNLEGTPWTKSFNGFGDTAVMNTIDKMKVIINDSAKNPYVRRYAEAILNKYKVSSYDWIGEAKAVHNWVRDNIRYTHDPLNVEYLQTPPVLLKLIERGERPMGDCDDMTMLSLSLLKSIGYPVGLKITSYNNSGKFQHVYGMVKVAVGKAGASGAGNMTQWLPVETIKPDKEFGFEAPNPMRVYTTEV